VWSTQTIVIGDLIAEGEAARAERQSIREIPYIHFFNVRRVYDVLKMAKKIYKKICGPYSFLLF